MEQQLAEIYERLAEPFRAEEVKFRAGATSGERALALAYVDARVVMDRLDEVLGLGNWQTSYREAANGVVCTLSVRIGGEWITHEDFGGFSEQPDDGDKHKAAFSDSLKRAAVHLGIGRYLYRLPQQWVGYDPRKKQLSERPRLPAWALPRAEGDRPQPAAQERATQERPAQPAPAPASGGGDRKPGGPANGAELVAWLKDADDACAGKYDMEPGTLTARVVAAVRKADFNAPVGLAQWSASHVALAVESARKIARDALARKQLRDALGDELERTGATWDDALEWLGLSESAVPEDVNAQALERALKHWRALPAAEAVEN